MLKTRTKYKACYKFDLELILGGATKYKARYKFDLEIALSGAYFQRDIDGLKVQPSDNDTSVLNLINAVAAFGVTEDDTDNNFSVSTCNTDGFVRATLHAFHQHSNLVQMLRSCFYIHRRFISTVCRMGGEIERKPNKYKRWCEQRCCE